MHSDNHSHQTYSLNSITHDTGVSHVPDALITRVEDIIAGSSFCNNDFYQKNIIVSETDGVSIVINPHEAGFDLSRIQLQLGVFIDTIYMDGMYLEDLDRESLECVLYGTQEEIKSKIIAGYDGIRICSSIQQMTDLQLRAIDKIYGGNIQIIDSMNATFVAHPFDYIRNQLGENYMRHEMFILRSDFFHAYFWRFGIRYYGNATFLRDIHNQPRDALDAILQRSKGIIAHGNNIIETKHDTRIDYETLEKSKLPNRVINNTQNFPPLNIRKRPVLGADGKVAPGNEVECIFPKVAKNQCVLEIVLGEPGKMGTSVGGKPLSYEDIKKISVKDLFDSTYIDYIDLDTSDPKKIRCIAREDVFISMDKQSKLGFSKYKKYIGNIGLKTGSLTLPRDGTMFELQGDIMEGYHIKGSYILYSGQLFGEIHAENNVTVKGYGIVGGSITVDAGNISIEKSVRIKDKTRLEAINGKIIINGDISGATIIAEDIGIEGTASHCIIIGGNIVVNENNGSRIMAETFIVNHDRNEKSEYTILIYAGIQGLINILQQNIKNSEGKGLLEEARVRNLGKGLNGDEILTGGNMHPDSRIQILVVPFTMNKGLQELLSIEMKPEIINSRKKDGVQLIITSDKKNEGVICSKNDLPLTRSQAIQTLTSRLSARLNNNTRSAERTNLYTRGLRLPITIGQLQGHIFDHSDTGGSYILVNNQKDTSSLISVGSTISVHLSSNSSVSVLVTRVDYKNVDNKKYIFVAGKYITLGIGPEITRVVAIFETRQRKSMNN